MATVTIPMPGPAGAQAVTTTTDQPSTGNWRQTFVEWCAADAAYVVDYAGVALRDYLVVTRGAIFFQGESPPDPRIDIRAETVSQGLAVAVTVIVTRTARRALRAVVTPP